MQQHRRRAERRPNERAEAEHGGLLVLLEREREVGELLAIHADRDGERAGAVQRGRREAQPLAVAHDGGGDQRQVEGALRPRATRQPVARERDGRVARDRAGCRAQIRHDRQRVHAEGRRRERRRVVVTVEGHLETVRGASGERSRQARQLRRRPARGGHDRLVVGKPAAVARSERGEGAAERDQRVALRGAGGRRERVEPRRRVVGEVDGVVRVVLRVERDRYSHAALAALAAVGAVFGRRGRRDACDARVVDHVRRRLGAPPAEAAQPRGVVAAEEALAQHEHVRAARRRPAGRLERVHARRRVCDEDGGGCRFRVVLVVERDGHGERRVGGVGGAGGRMRRRAAADAAAGQRDGADEGRVVDIGGGDARAVEGAVVGVAARQARAGERDERVAGERAAHGADEGDGGRREVREGEARRRELLPVGAELERHLARVDESPQLQPHARDAVGVGPRAGARADAKLPRVGGRVAVDAHVGEEVAPVESDADEAGRRALDEHGRPPVQPQVVDGAVLLDVGRLQQLAAVDELDGVLQQRLGASPLHVADVVLVHRPHALGDEAHAQPARDAVAPKGGRAGPARQLAVADAEPLAARAVAKVRVEAEAEAAQQRPRVAPQRQPARADQQRAHLVVVVGRERHGAAREQLRRPKQLVPLLLGAARVRLLRERRARAKVEREGALRAGERRRRCEAAHLRALRDDGRVDHRRAEAAPEAAVGADAAAHKVAARQHHLDAAGRPAAIGCQHRDEARSVVAVVDGRRRVLLAVEAHLERHRAPLLARQQRRVQQRRGDAAYRRRRDAAAPRRLAELRAEDGVGRVAEAAAHVVARAEPGAAHQERSRAARGAVVEREGDDARRGVRRKRQRRRRVVLPVEGDAQQRRLGRAHVGGSDARHRAGGSVEGGGHRLLAEAAAQVGAEAEGGAVDEHARASVDGPARGARGAQHGRLVVEERHAHVGVVLLIERHLDGHQRAAVAGEPRHARVVDEVRVGERAAGAGEGDLPVGGGAQQVEREALEQPQAVVRDRHDLPVEREAHRHERVAAELLDVDVEDLDAAEEHAHVLPRARANLVARDEAHEQRAVGGEAAVARHAALRQRRPVVDGQAAAAARRRALLLPVEANVSVKVEVERGDGARRALRCEERRDAVAKLVRRVGGELEQVAALRRVAVEARLARLAARLRLAHVAHVPAVARVRRETPRPLRAAVGVAAVGVRAQTVARVRVRREAMRVWVLRRPLLAGVAGDRPVDEATVVGAVGLRVALGVDGVGGGGGAKERDGHVARRRRRLRRGAHDLARVDVGGERHVRGAKGAARVGEVAEVVAVERDARAAVGGAGARAEREDADGRRRLKRQRRRELLAVERDPQLRGGVVRHRRRRADDRAANAEARVERGRHARRIEGARVVAAAAEAAAAHVHRRAALGRARRRADRGGVGLVVHGERGPLVRELLRVERDGEDAAARVGGSGGGAVVVAGRHAGRQRALDGGDVLLEVACVEAVAEQSHLGTDRVRAAEAAAVRGAVAEAAAVHRHRGAAVHRPARRHARRGARHVVVTKRHDVAVLLAVERDGACGLAAAREAAAVAVAAAQARRHQALHAEAALVGLHQRGARVRSDVDQRGAHEPRAHVCAVVRAARLAAAAVVGAVGQVVARQHDQRRTLVRARARRRQGHVGRADVKEGARAGRVLLAVESDAERLRAARRRLRGRVARHLARGGEVAGGHAAGGAKGAIVLGAGGEVLGGDGDERAAVVRTRARAERGRAELRGAVVAVRVVGERELLAVERDAEEQRASAAHVGRRAVDQRRRGRHGGDLGGAEAAAVVGAVRELGAVDRHQRRALDWAGVGRDDVGDGLGVRAPVQTFGVLLAVERDAQRVHRRGHLRRGARERAADGVVRRGGCRGAERRGAREAAAVVDAVGELRAVDGHERAAELGPRGGAARRGGGALVEGELDAVVGEVLVVERHLEAVLADGGGGGRDAAYRRVDAAVAGGAPPRRVVRRAHLRLAEAAPVRADRAAVEGAARDAHERAASDGPTARAERGDGGAAVREEDVVVGRVLLAVERDLQRHRALGRHRAVAHERAGVDDRSGREERAETAARHVALPAELVHADAVVGKVAARHVEQDAALGGAAQREDRIDDGRSVHEEVERVDREVLPVGAHVDRHEAMRAAAAAAAAAAAPRARRRRARDSGRILVDRRGGHARVLAKRTAVVDAVREVGAGDGDGRAAVAGARGGA